VVLICGGDRVLRRLRVHRVLSASVVVFAFGLSVLTIQPKSLERTVALDADFHPVKIGA